MPPERLSYLSQNDAIMWQVESDPLLRSTIVAVSILDRAPEWERVVAATRRTIDHVPALRHRVVPAPLHHGTLQWVPADVVDLDHHLRHVVLPAPGTVDQLLEHARASGAARFDPDRPLWHFTLVEGLENGRAAFVTVAHHVVTDGIGAVQLAAHLFDLTADPAPGPTAADPTAAVRETDASAEGHAPDVVHRWLDAVARDVGVAASVARHGIPALIPDLLHALRHPIEASTEIVETTRSIARAVAPAVDTKSPLIADRRPVGRYQSIEVPLDDLRAAAATVGATVNDAYLAAITGGLRRYHEHHGAPVETLRMAMPISLRSDGDRTGGNRVSLLRFEVPVDETDPAARLAALHELGARIRAERSLAHTEAIAAVLNLLPRQLLGTILKHVDVIASNVPGVPVPLYLGGAEVERVIPFGPTAGSSVNLTLMSYCGTCSVGVHADTAAIPDAEVFLESLRAGFDEVVALAR